MIEGGKRLNVDIDVEDLGAFTGPWSENATFSKANYNVYENVCAENKAPIGMDTKSGDAEAKYVAPF
jgi:hypothetical protein